MKILKGLIVLVAFIFIFVNKGYCEIYVCLDRESGDVIGMVDINPDSVGSWAKTYTMKEAGESYRGKQGYEMKYVNQKLRMATEKEITDYKQAQEQAAITVKKADMLATLEIDTKDIEKIKKLPEGV